MQSIKTLPKQPGVYLFKDKLNEIIYIGKAKSLHSRVSSYFNKSAKTPKTSILVKNIVEIDHIIVDNEIEALLLENKLIKKHRPKYNIDLKDSKTYAYIKITDEVYPRIITTRDITQSKNKSNGIYFGPYTDGSARREIIDLCVKLFKLRVCKNLPKRACLNYHIGLCSAPCIKNVTKEEYQIQVKQALNFLKGNTNEVTKRLEKEMNEASKTLKYEIAKEKLNQIQAIEHLNHRQKVDLIKRFDQDIIACVYHKNSAIFSILKIDKGVISQKSQFQFELQDNIFEDFIKAYYSTNQIPNEIIVNEKFWETEKDKVVLEKYLEKIKGMKVTLTLPIKGEKKELVELATKNVNLEEDDLRLVEIKEKLNLPKIPSIIECFDISNLGSDDVVAGMTRFVNAKEDKSGYRKFEIKSLIDKQDDFASMREVVYRRYKRLQDENSQMPDLIIIDGGLGQLSSALISLRSLGLQIPIISLAKKDEEIYIPDDEIPLRFDTNSKMMLLIRNIRDNTHRFVITYNRKKREMRLKDEMK